MQVNDQNQLKSAYNSDKKAYNQALSAIKEDHSQATEELIDARNKIAQLEWEKKTLLTDIDFYKDRLQSVERNYESK